MNGSGDIAVCTGIRDRGIGLAGRRDEASSPRSLIKTVRRATKGGRLHVHDG